jgi:hypothetical protein
MLRNGQTTAPPDIGSIIQSFLTTATVPAAPAPTIHTEQSVDGWLEVTSAVFHGPHFEVSTDGFGQPTTHVVPAPNNGPQVTTPGANTTPPPYVPIPVVTPPPVITQGAVTLQPVPVTSVKVTTVDGKPTTVEAEVNYRYVVGSATLAIGTPTTINNVVIALSLDSSGSTVLVAGDQTTTLPRPARATQAPADSQPNLEISTTVIEGTTKYILAGQTLAPGQAITIDNIPISIGTVGAGSSTVLVVGDMTTTLPVGPGAATTTSPKEWSTSTAATPGIVSGNGSNKPAKPSATSSGEPSARATMMSCWLLVAFSALFPVFA